MHVDGFRFDLAVALAGSFMRLAGYRRFDLVQQDPVVSQVKVIAKPWDVGEGGYHVGKISRRCGPNGTASTATRSATCSDISLTSSATGRSWAAGGCAAYAMCSMMSARGLDECMLYPLVRGPIVGAQGKDGRLASPGYPSARRS